MWPCEAYGVDGQEIGAWCFVAPMWARSCADPGTCSERMAAERLRVWNRIRELAASGAPEYVELAELFSSPEEMLGGPAERE